MKKIIFRNPRENLDFENLKGERTLVILPSQSAINFYIRDMLKKGIDITKTEFETFDGIGKKYRRKKPDSILKYLILSKILKDNFTDMEIFPETVDIILDFFDDISENNLSCEDILKINGEIFTNLSNVFKKYRDYFEKEGYDLYGRLKDFSVEESPYDSIIISGFLEFRKNEEEIIKRLVALDSINVYLDLPFNFIKSELISSNIKSLEDLGFILEEGKFLDYKKDLKKRKIRVISSENDFYNLFFSQLKLLLKDNKVSDLDILTGSISLANKIKAREKFEGLEFNVRSREKSLLKSEFLLLMEYFLNKSKENVLKRVSLMYFPLDVDIISLESALMTFDFKNLSDIDFKKLKSLDVNLDSVKTFLDGVDYLQKEEIEELGSLNFYIKFFDDYLKAAREKIREEVEVNPESLALRDLRFIDKMEENFLKMKNLSSLYKEISLFDFVLITKKYIEKSDIDKIQNLEGLEIASYTANYYRNFKNLILIGFDKNFERNIKNNFLYKRESEKDMKKIGLLKDNFRRDYIYLLYDLLSSDEIFILIEDREKGLSKLLNTLIYEMDLKIKEQEKKYKTSKLDYDYDTHDINYNVSNYELSGINEKIMKRNYSVTDFDILKDCPRRFLFERVYKIEKLEKEYDEKYYLNEGDKFHHILEKYFKRERVLNVESLKDIILEEENLGKFDDLSFLEKISVINTFTILKNYIEKDLEEQRKYGFSPKYFEEGFLMNLSGLKIKGRIDRIDALSDEEILIDYKRSRGKSKQEILDLKSFQMPLYAIARKKLGKKIASASYGSIKRGEISTVIKNSDLLPRDDKKRNYFTEEEIGLLLKNVEDEILRMTRSIALGDYTSTSDCENCDYKEICENKEN